MTKKKFKLLRKKIKTFIGFLICLLLLPILVLNISIIIKSVLYPEQVPTIFGVAPMVIVTDSMNAGNDSIAAGDIIFAVKTDIRQLVIGDIILFKHGKGLVLHRIVSINESENGRAFVTKGDANNAQDSELVYAESIIGKYIERIPKFGHFVLFLKTTLGMVIFIILPIFIILGYELFKKNRAYRKQKLEFDELQSKLFNYEKKKNLEELHEY
jgi:signal peptidase I, archaeal type